MRTDLTWWLLAPNPFVVLADAAPKLPEQPLPPVLPDDTGVPTVQAADLDPLGQIGKTVRDLRRPPSQVSDVGPGALQPGGAVDPAPQPEAPPVWPTGLAVNVLLGAAALALTVRRLRTPSRTLPRGQRVA